MNEAIKPQRKRKPKPIRFKIIRPVYETLTVNDQNARYQDAHLSSSRDVIRLFDFLSRETKEHFWAVHLDSKNRMLCLDQVSTGSLNASILHPREVYKSALLSSAAALLLVHNHPSGDLTPSNDNFGGGLKYFLTDDVALLADVRDILVDGDSFNNDILNNLSISIGMTFQFGPFDSFDSFDGNKKTTSRAR